MAYFSRRAFAATYFGLYFAGVGAPTPPPSTPFPFHGQAETLRLARVHVASVRFSVATDFRVRGERIRAAQYEAGCSFGAVSTFSVHGVRVPSAPPPHVARLRLSPIPTALAQTVAAASRPCAVAFVAETSFRAVGECMPSLTEWTIEHDDADIEEILLLLAVL